MRFLAFILYADHISQLTQFHIASSAVRNQGRKSEEPPTGLIRDGDRLAVNGEVGGDCVVTGKADFLAAGHSHAVYAADDRFLHMRMESTILLKSSMYDRILRVSCCNTRSILSCCRRCRRVGSRAVNIVATTERSVEEFSKPAMTPFTISVV